MFITEQQLLELKHNRNSKYYGHFLSSIFIDELDKFNEHTEIKLMVAIEPFFHRRIAKDLWQVKFSDNSVILIKYRDDKYYLNVFQTHDDIFSFERL